jgi:aconitate hydratase 2 / 2-methylisocitrate dehydratase
MSFLDEYKKHCDERAALGNLPALALTIEQTQAVIELIMTSEKKDEFLADLIANRVNPGVDDAAKIKAEFLAKIVSGEVKVATLSAVEAVSILGKMLGGYNVKPLIDALSSSDLTVAKAAANELKGTLLVYEAFNDVVELAKSNVLADEVLTSWANAEWFTNRPSTPDVIKGVVFKVPGETNTDDLSPAGEAFTRADIPLHANAMLRAKMPDGLATLAKLKATGAQIIYVGDVVGTGSSRKSALNSVQWCIGDDIPGVPNKRTSGVVIGGVIAPIFFATCEDSGALPIQADVTQMESGDDIEIDIKNGEIRKNGAKIASFTLNPNTILD